MARLTGAAAQSFLGLALAALPPGLPAADLPATAPSADAGLAEVVVTARRVSESLWEKNRPFDEARDRTLLPKLGVTAFSLDQEALQSLPQGTNTPLDKALLQIPGVSYDSAISNPDFHVRNEYANVQFRINGIQLPDGVSALGPVLETGFIGSLELLDGTLPAQYGLRTAGVVDITTRTVFDQGGSLDLYGGTWSTLSPSVDYGGGVGRTQYFLTARYLQSEQGLENAMPTQDPIHDRTTQEKFFGYGSTLLGDASRLTYMAGGFVGHFQIPDVAGAQPLGDYGSPSLSSASLDETETDRFYFGVAALQTHAATLDSQLSVFTRYATVHFLPDLYGDLAFNDVASNVVRQSLLNGVQFDASDRLGETHTLRAGVTFSLEKTHVRNLSTLLPLGPDGEPSPTPVTVNDVTGKLGWIAGGYLQDEWRIRPDLTLNAGLRFDEMSQFVSAGQLSPRVAIIYEPRGDTTIHAGVARYFTPPMQAQATPDNLSLFQGTVQQPAIPLDDPVRPERATYFDVGADRTVLPGLTAGLDLYYKRSTDTLDDGQFGQAVVLNEFNFADGLSRGEEIKVAWRQAGFRAYVNASHEITLVKKVVSNEYLIGDPTELAYLATAYTYASDAQTVSASAGVSYRRQALLASLDGFYGSGLRAGFANQQHSPGYTQWNAALGRDFDPWNDDEPLTVRLSVLNLLDRRYLLRAATGIGEYAPQYGPRRGFFVELTQRF